MNYRILIIDDEFGTRRDAYRDLFPRSFGSARFYLYDAITKDAIVDWLRQVDIVITDIFLGDKEGRPLYIDGEYLLDIIKGINASIPVILVSKIWGKIEYERYKKLLLSQQIVGGVTFDELTNKDVSQKFRFEVIHHIFKYRNHLDLSIDDSSPIHFLHLSDIQYGGKWSIGQSTDSNIALKQTMLIGDAVQKALNRQYPHCLICSGDITQSAEAAQYQLARRHLNNLLANFQIARDGCFLVPGNHDVSLQQACSIDIKYAFPSKKNRQASCELKEDSSQDLSSLQSGFINPGLSLFRDFCCSFLERNEWAINWDDINDPSSGIYFISNKLEPYGINIVGINSVNNIRRSSPDESSIDSRSIAKLTLDLGEIYQDSKDCVNIICLHHPVILNAEHQDLLASVDSLSDTIFIFGHRHDDFAGIQKCTSNTRKSSIYICAPTLTMEYPARADNVLTGFNLITFLRKDGVVNGVNVDVFLFSKNKYKIDCSYRFIRNADTGWVQSE